MILLKRLGIIKTMIKLKQPIKNIIRQRGFIYGGGGVLFLLLLIFIYYFFFAAGVLKDMVFIPGGEYIMGIDIPQKEGGRKEEEITKDAENRGVCDQIYFCGGGHCAFFRLLQWFKSNRSVQNRLPKKTAVQIVMREGFLMLLIP